MEWPDVQAALHVIQLAKDHPKLRPLTQRAMEELEKESELLVKGKPEQKENDNGS